jgi:hypothetical protein
MVAIDLAPLDVTPEQLTERRKALFDATLGL